MPGDACEVCGRFPNRPVTADAIVERDGRVLLIKRHNPPFAGMYALPGGFVDLHETPEECAVRELEEETAVRGAVARLVGIYDSADRDPFRHVITFAYAVKASPSSEAQAGDDAAEIAWAPLDQLPPLAFDHTRILADYRAGQHLVVQRRPDQHTVGA